MTDAEIILSELRALRSQLGKLSGAEPHALKRTEAARAIGISRRKLDQLIDDGKIKTADDVHLVPMVEVRRYCTPKAPRQRKPAVGQRARRAPVEAQSDMALSDLRQRLRAKANGSTQ